MSHLRSGLGVLLVALFLASCASLGDREGESEWVRPLPYPLAGEPGTFGTVRVLSGPDHDPRPVPGARVLLYWEYVEGDIVAAPFTVEATTDEFGIAAIPPEATRDEHRVVLAEGFAPGYEFNYEYHQTIVLERGEERCFRVLGPLGRPLAGARVSAFRGCPHSPILREAVTDASGLVDLGRLAESNLFVEAPGVDPGPYGLPRHLVGFDGATLLTRPGLTARGTVTRASGAPAPGIVVRSSSSYPRGPVTTTDAEGRFALHGIHAPGVPLVFFDPAAEPPYDPVLEADFDADVPIRVALPGPSDVEPGSAEPLHEVVVELVADSGATPVPGEIPVVLARLTDGLTVRAESSETVDDGDGLARSFAHLEAPRGRFRLRAGGGFSGALEESIEIDVPVAGVAPVRLHVREAPRLASDRLDAESIESATLVIAGGETGFTPDPDSLPSLPPSGDAAVRVVPSEAMGDEWLVAVSPDAIGGARTVVASAPPATRLTARVVSADGTPLLPTGRYNDSPAGEWTADEPGRWTMSTHLAGRTTLRFAADGDFEHETLAVRLPIEPGREIDLGRVVLRDAPKETRLLDATGSPDEDARLERSDDGTLVVFRYTADADAEILPYALPAAAAGKDEIRLPGGRVRLTVKGPRVDPLPFVLHFDGFRFDAPSGSFEVRGVPAGPHVLLVGAADHASEARRIVLADGETREIEIALEESR